MLKRTGLIWMSALLLMALNSSAPAQQNNLAPVPNNFQPAKSNAQASPAPAAIAAGVDTDRVRDGLLGPVRRVRTETAKLSNKNGALVEQPHVLLETAAYDLKGNKIENAYFPIAGETLTGKEMYKYNEKGNISEMILQNADGSLLSKETYTYDYDAIGNWTRMATSVAVVADGKLSFEPVETTYRVITYYLDENLVKMMQPAPLAPGVNALPATAATSLPVKPNAQPATIGTASAGKASSVAGIVSAPSLPAAVSTDKSRMAAAGLDALAVPVNAASKASGPAVLMASEPPATQAPKPLLGPVSGGVLNGKALSLPKPVYPESARRVRAEGMVNVEVILDETGKVISARATGGPTVLREAAMQAAQRARFSPTKISDQPVKVSGNITYNFTLAQ